MFSYLFIIYVSKYRCINSYMLYNTQWTQIIWAVSNIYLTTTKQHTEMKFTPLEEELQKFL
jgi:hypothetical protein